MIREPNLLGSPGVPQRILPMDMLERYPALDRIWLRAAYALAQQPAPAPVLCAHAVFRSLAEDGAAFSDDALASAAREAVRLGLRRAAIVALDRMAAFSADQRRTRDELRAALPGDETPLGRWFAGPAQLMGALLPLLPPDGRILAFGASAALLVGYAPERRWAFPLLGSAAVAAHRYAAGTFGAAVLSEPCDALPRAALLESIRALEIDRTYSVEPAGSPREHPGLRAETVVSGTIVHGPAALGGTVLWSLGAGGVPDDRAESRFDIVRWCR